MPSRCISPSGDWSGSVYDPFRKVLTLHNNHENWWECMRLTCYTRPRTVTQLDGQAIAYYEDAGCDYHFLSGGGDRAQRDQREHGSG